MTRTRLGGGFLLLAVVASLLQSGQSAAIPVPRFPQVRVRLTFRGTVVLSRLAAASRAAAPASSAGAPLTPLPLRTALGGGRSGGGPPAVTAAEVVAGQLPGFRTFRGLGAADQRSADPGMSPTGPPGVALCVGPAAPRARRPVVLEAVGDALQVFTAAGRPRLRRPVTLNELFRLGPPLRRSGPPTPHASGSGPRISDPRCSFDADTGRWFLVASELEVRPDSGTQSPRSHVELAVSRGRDPAGAWNLYALDTTNGSDPGCPCFADRPLIGSDRYGFYVTFAEYSLGRLTGRGTGRGVTFNGPQLYAFPKAALAAGRRGRRTVGGVRFFDLSTNRAGPPRYDAASMAPAASAFGEHDARRGGTMYFGTGREISPADRSGTVGPALESHMTVWALTNTRSLAWPAPSLRLSTNDLVTEPYGQPALERQRSGPTPLGTRLGRRSLPAPVWANDDRIQQLVYQGGYLWSALTTVVLTLRDDQAVPTRESDGIAWFVVSVGGRSAQPSIANQGYLAVDGASLLVPSLAVNRRGEGILAFSVVGPNDYPSPAYVGIDLGGTDAIRLAARGSRPEDGFTCYPEFGGGPCRWGGSSAAVADPGGRLVWFAGGSVGTAGRTALSDWETIVSVANPNPPAS